MTGDDPLVVIDRSLALLQEAARRLAASGQFASGTGSVHGLFTSGGGVPKLAVDEVVIDLRGVVGDVQKTQRHHGRPWQALCLWSKEKVDLLAAEGHPITYGAAGENVSVTGHRLGRRPTGRAAADRRGPGRVQPLLAAVRQEPTLVRGPRQHAHAPRDRARHQPHVRLGARAGLCPHRRPGGARALSRRSALGVGPGGADRQVDLERHPQVGGAVHRGERELLRSRPARTAAPRAAPRRAPGG